MRHLLSVFLCFFYVIALAQQMPVVGYMGVPSSATSPATYRQMKACGFNTSISIFPSTRAMFQALDVASQVGMKLIPHCPSVLRATPADIQRMVQHEAFLYYMVGDEPNRNKLPQFVKTQRQLRAMYANIPFYVNLAPCYDSQILQWLGFESYEDYVQECCDSLEFPILSFDYYPIVQSKLLFTRVRSSWYDNLRTVRKIANDRAIPFWGFVLSTPHAVYPQPTMEHLRMQIYTNLLFGAKGIQYFTYWTPPKEPKYDYYNGPISRDGVRTETYTLVQRMNKELQQVAPLFMEGNVQQVGLYADVVADTSWEKRIRQQMKNMTLSNNNALVSHLRTSEGDYLLIQNANLNDKLRVRLVSTDGVRHMTKHMKYEQVRESYQLEGGDILILFVK